VAVIERRENLETTTAPTEIVRCRLAGGREFTLLCKYAATPDGHRRGVTYESDVYRQVLMPLRASTPRFFGAHIDSVTGDTRLFIEYLKDMQRVTWREEPDAYTWGIRWIARFHARAEAFLRGNSLPFLLRLDAAYYGRWMERAAVFVDAAAGRYRWFPMLFERFQEFGPSMLTRRPTVVHGMYFSKNVVCQGPTVRPIDWEAAGAGAGELDLATVTTGWPARVMTQAEQDYSRARWPDGGPADFPLVLAAARIHLGIRWLVESPESRTDREEAGICRILRAAGERLGWIS
jgi:hypothetical protein